MIDKIKAFLTKHIDKFLHFLVCFCLVSLFSLIHPWVGVMVALLAGFGKETYDWLDYGKAMGWAKCWPLALGDLVADGIGIITYILGGVA